MSTPSPGPWHASRLATPEYAPEFGIYAEGHRRDLAQVVGPNSAADARLIAAAPELLTALTALVARPPFDNTKETSALRRDAKRAAYAAIAAATED